MNRFLCGDERQVIIAKTRTSFECSFTDGRYALGNCYSCEACTALERRVRDNLGSLRNNDALQACAARKGRNINGPQSLREFNVTEVLATEK